MATISRPSVAAIAGIVLMLGPAYIGSTTGHQAESPGRIEFQQAADTTAMQRRAAWAIVVSLAGTASSAGALLAGWHHSEDLFPASSGVQGAGTHGRLTQSPEPQIVIFTLFNELAFQHIRRHDLQSEAELTRLEGSGDPDSKFPLNRTIPPLPDGAMVLLTAWWPMARHRLTATPVWDPELNPPLPGGNNYITWQRSVAVDAAPVAGSAAAVTSIDFGGRRFANARRLGLDSFQYIRVDRKLADKVMHDGLSRKAAVIALGRPLEEGDSLALVAVHVAAKQSGHWVWATLWWHDQPDRGQFAEGRPDDLRGAWRNYLLDTPTDSASTRAMDRGPNICFNPWLEARFPDTGSGGGTSSNCIACHERASYPIVSFLPITRGTADVVNDPAYAPGRVRTDMLWSLARRSSQRTSTPR